MDLSHQIAVLRTGLISEIFKVVLIRLVLIIHY